MDVINNITENEIPTKCGEIFLTNNGNFTINCVFCFEKFQLQNAFANHVLERHLSDDLLDSYDSFEESITFENIEDRDFIETIDEDAIEKNVKTEQLNDTYKNYLSVFGGEALYKTSDSIDLKNGITLINENQLIELVEDDNELFFGTNNIKKKELVDDNPKDDVNLLISSNNSTCNNENNTTENHKVKELVKCQHCGACFNDKDDLFAHYVIHKVNKCSFCNKKYMKIEALKLHEHKHMNPFRCSFCIKTFFKKTMLREHENTHLGIKPHKCEFCPSTFTSRTNLKVHRNRHLNIRPYSCRFCEKCFVATTERKMHERAHRGDRPAICELCGVSFLNTQKLNEHKKRHTNLREFTCNICSKAFFSKNQLNQHHICHINEQPFKCEFCEANFKRKKNLVQHLHIHHNGSVKNHLISNDDQTILKAEIGEYIDIEEHEVKYNIPDTLIEQNINDVCEILTLPILVGEQILANNNIL